MLLHKLFHFEIGRELFVIIVPLIGLRFLGLIGTSDKQLNWSCWALLSAWSRGYWLPAACRLPEIGSVVNFTRSIAIYLGGSIRDWMLASTGGRRALNIKFNWGGLRCSQILCVLVSIFVIIFAFIERKLAVSVSYIANFKKCSWSNFASYASMIAWSCKAVCALRF